jgi:hypothetical protein
MRPPEIQRGLLEEISYFIVYVWLIFNPDKEIA